VGAQRDPEPTLSLGAWLASLGPGDSCPCCGARLERGTHAAAAHPGPNEGAQAQDVDIALVCARCGFESDAATDGGPGARGSSFRVAA
jgi:hypothetical protein